jgi:hypothetical protein
MRQQQNHLMSLLTDIKLKVKDGTHKTLVSVRLFEILMVPMWVTEATTPFGSWTLVEMIAVILVKKETEQTIWSVALVSTIQGGLLKERGKEVWSKWEEETKYWELRTNIPKVDEELAVFGLNWETCCTELATGDEAIFWCWMNAINCWHCSSVIGSCGGGEVVESVPCTWVT